MPSALDELCARGPDAQAVPLDAQLDGAYGATSCCSTSNCCASASRTVNRLARDRDCPSDRIRSAARSILRSRVTDALDVISRFTRVKSRLGNIAPVAPRFTQASTRGQMSVGNGSVR